METDGSNDLLTMPDRSNGEGNLNSNGGDAPKPNVPGKPRKDDPLEELNQMTARDLQEKKVAPPSFVVDGILPEGFSILAAMPKVGKTLFAQNISVSIASGMDAFGSVPVKKGRVLFLALEGSEGSMKSRFQKMLGDQKWPEELNLIRPPFPTLESGGMKTIEKVVNYHKDTRLIVVDPLQLFRGEGSGSDAYQKDYEALGPLVEFCANTDVSVLAIHHANKRLRGSSNTLNYVTGSTAITAAADNVLFMDKSNTAHGQVEVSVIARDQERQELNFTLDEEQATWKPENTVVASAGTPERREILKIIEQSEEDALGPQEIAERLGKNEKNVRSMLSKMRKKGEVTRPAYGEYTVPPPTP
jgi:RecA-family ATPase